jgi:hypothetical protein
MRKGIAKFWIEIIGGVIVVVIILVIVVFAGSQTGTIIEDAAATNAFHSFIQTMAKATSSGTHTTSPWTLVMSRDNSVYAIAYMTQNLADTISTSREELDSESKFNLKKCIPESPDDTDACLCMMSIRYKSLKDPNNPIGIADTCDDMPFNLIAVDSASTHQDELNNLAAWNQKFANFLFTMESIKVLECSRVKPLCSYPTGASPQTARPCTIHYRGSPVAWISAQGGLLNIGPINTLDKLEVEVLKMDKDVNNFYIEMEALLETDIFTDRICAIKNCPPCYKCPGTACTPIFTGLGCSTTGYPSNNCAP